MRTALLVLLFVLVVGTAVAMAQGTAPIATADLAATQANILAQVDVAKTFALAIFAVVVALTMGFKIVKRLANKAA